VVSNIAAPGLHAADYSAAGRSNSRAMLNLRPAMTHGNVQQKYNYIYTGIYFLDKAQKKLCFLLHAEKKARGREFFLILLLKTFYEIPVHYRCFISIYHILLSPTDGF